MYTTEYWKKHGDGPESTDKWFIDHIKPGNEFLNDLKELGFITAHTHYMTTIFCNSVIDKYVTGISYVSAKIVWNMLYDDTKSRIESLHAKVHYQGCWTIRDFIDKHTWTPQTHSICQKARHTFYIKRFVKRTFDYQLMGALLSQHLPLDLVYEILKKVSWCYTHNTWTY